MVIVGQWCHNIEPFTHSGYHVLISQHRGENGQTSARWIPLSNTAAGDQWLSRNSGAINSDIRERKKMLNISLLQQINHSHIRQRTKVMDSVEYICKMKWRWAGHVARMTDNRWTIRSTEWTPRDGRRSVGRPFKRWMDDIASFLC